MQLRWVTKDQNNCPLIFVIAHYSYHTYTHIYTLRHMHNKLSVLCICTHTRVYICIFWLILMPIFTQLIKRLFSEKKEIPVVLEM